MPFIQSDSVRLHYRVDEPSQAGAQAPWLMLCSSLGATQDMWWPQLEALSQHFRVLRYDRRGHGQSSTPPGLYTLDDLGRDALAVLDAVGAQRAHFCGISLGGLTGQWLAVNAPQRLGRLVLCSTAVKIGTEAAWRVRIEQAQREGLAGLAESSISRWFTPAFIAAQPDAIERIRKAYLAGSPHGYAGCCNALIDADFRPLLPRMTTPLLAIAGTSDPTAPPAELRAIAAGVADGRCVELPAAHLSNIEAAAAFNRALLGFLVG
jgi:3-oxoadipate enol-lactonase